MAETIRLAPHDPLPDDKSCILVLRRFAEEDPGRVEIEISRSAGGFSREGVAVRDGDLAAAVAEAERLAAVGGLKRVYVVDRAAGEREQEVLARHGDHSAGMDRLEDADEEDGEPGADMRRP